MTRTEAIKITEVDMESPSMPITSFNAASSVRLWKEHYDKEFFKKGILGTFAGVVVDADDIETVNAPEIDKHSLPNDLSRKLSTRSPYIVSFYSLQEWDGYVVKVGKESFKVRLTDLTNGGEADAEEAEIAIDELDDDVASKLANGQLFRWTIGYERCRSGQKKRTSRIIFRQLPAWTEDDLMQAKEEAASLSQSLLWE